MTSSTDPRFIQQIASQFQLPAPIGPARRIPSGHIHDTFAVACHHNGSVQRYILQNVNTWVFKKPEEVMDNIRRVCDHLRAKLEALPGADAERETLTIMFTTTGDMLWTAADSDCWRCFRFIENASTYNVPQSAGQAREAARAFGRFQRLLSDLPPPRLHETIPNFHHTPGRFAALRRAIAEDKHGRVEVCQSEIAFALQHETLTPIFTSRLADGSLPERITHNDTKINNVMFDDHSQRGLCVIDLDTVMPGTVLYDFGEQVRTTAGHFREDEQDFALVQLDLEFFGALVDGYLEEAGLFLTSEEKRHLHLAGQLMAYENGIRFLTDFLDGDLYFRIHYPLQNLNRCRTQFAYVRSMEEHADEMAAIVARHG